MNKLKELALLFCGGNIDEKKFKEEVLMELSKEETAVLSLAFLVSNTIKQKNELLNGFNLNLSRMISKDDMSEETKDFAKREALRWYVKQNKKPLFNMKEFEEEEFKTLKD